MQAYEMEVYGLVVACVEALPANTVLHENQLLQLAEGLELATLEATLVPTFAP